MADKTVIVEIVYDTEAATKNLNELTSVVEGERIAQQKLKQELENGTKSQKDYSIELEKSKKIAGDANKERKNTLDLISSEKGSINELKANIKLLTTERDKLNQSTADGKKTAGEYNAKIKEMQAALKGAKEESGKTSGAFAAFGKNLKEIPGPIGGIINGFVGMTKAAMAFILTPIGAVIAALVLGFKALTSYLKGSEEGQNRLNKILNVGKAIFEALMDVVEAVGKIIFDAISKPKETIIKLGELIKVNLINRFKAFGEIGRAIAKIFSGEFKQGFKDLANGAIQMTTGVTNAIDKVKNAAISAKNAINELSESVKKKAAQAVEMSNLQAKIDKEERKLLVAREKTRVGVDELLLAAKKKDINSETERLAILQKASKMIDALATAETKLAQDRLKSAQLRLQIEGDTKEALDEVAQAEANIISKKAEGLEARRKIEGQISELTLKTQNQENQAVQNTVKNNNIVNESDKDTQEDILRRRGEAIMRLAELKSKEIEQEAETYAEKRDIQIARAEEELALKLEQDGILAEEVELAQQEHKMRLAEIEADYQSNIEEQRKKALEQSLNDLNAIIAATQGMADKRVTIMSAAFAKLATIDYKGVKSASDAFVAIGAAASGLTELLVQDHQKELDDLTAKKEAELALVGDNKEAQDQINKKYARKEQELKKKQFDEDKKKALIDAAIATAIAVVKGLASGLPMPGILMAALAAVLGGIQIAAIAKQQYTPSASFAEGGQVIGGKPHSLGGTKFYGEDGTTFEAEKGEGIFVLKKDATAEIAAYSRLNESFGGRSWIGRPSTHLAEGGEAATIDIEKTVDEAISRTPIFVKVGDIETGLTEVSNVKIVGVV